MSAMNPPKRLFIAVMPPAEVQERVAALVDLLGASSPLGFRGFLGL